MGYTSNGRTPDDLRQWHGIVVCYRPFIDLAAFFCVVKDKKKKKKRSGAQICKMATAFITVA